MALDCLPALPMVKKLLDCTGKDIDSTLIDSFYISKKSKKPKMAKEIGDARKVAEKYDFKNTERDETRKCRKNLLKKGHPACAARGIYGPNYCHPITDSKQIHQFECANRKTNKTCLEAHHIEPIEVGGKTEDKNIILLCPCCHKKVHEGRASIERLGKLIALKGNERPDVQETMFCDPQPSVIDAPRLAKPILEEIKPWEQRRFFSKSISFIECSLSAINVENMEGIEAKHYLEIKKTELMRRRAGTGKRDEALKILNNKIFLKINKLDHVNQLRFYNERAFIYRLLGCHKQAITDSETAIELCNSGNYDPEFITASLCKLACKLAQKDKENVKADEKELIRELDELKNKVDGFGDKYWQGRCSLNIVSNKLKVYIKARDRRMSWTTLAELQNRYFRSDIENGWTESIMDTVSQLSGLTRVYCYPENKCRKQVQEKGRKLLARAFNARINNNEHFGDIRDIGFGLAKAIKDTDGKERNAQAIVKIMDKTIDGASFLNSFVAPSSEMFPHS